MTIYTFYLINYEIFVSETYATDEEGIKELALKWYWTDWVEEKCRVEVNVDIDNRTVTIYNPADRDSITYDIVIYDKREES